MSAIFLVFNRNGAPVRKDFFNNISESLNHHALNGSSITFLNEFALGIHHNFSTPEESNLKQPVKIDSDNYLLFNGRLDNRDYLLKKLNINSNPDISDAQIIALLFKEFNRNFFSQLLGSYVFIVCNTRDKSVIAVRDHLGDKNLFYYCDSKKLIISSEEHSILKHPELKPELEEHRLVEYFCTFERFDNRTYFKNIYEIYPANYLEVNRTDLYQRKYWDLSNEKKLRYKNTEYYYEHFREIFTNSVECRLRSVNEPAILLSGGIDSSAITSVCCKILEKKENKNQLKTFSYYSENQKSIKDFEYINYVNEFFNLDHKIFNTDNWLPFDQIESDFLSPNYPQLPIFFGQLNTVYSQMYRENRRTVLNGHNADQLLQTGNFWLKDLLKDMKLATALEGISEHINKFGLSWIYKSKSFRNLFSFVKPVLKSFLTEKTHDRYEDWSTDYAIDLINNRDFWIHDKAGHHHYEQLLYGLGLSQSQDCSDYVVNIAGGPMDFRLPFRDRRVVTFLLNIPSYLVYDINSRNKNKKIIKESLKNLLPQRIYERNDAGAYNHLVRDGFRKNRDTIFNYLKNKESFKAYIDSRWFENIKKTDTYNDYDLIIIWKIICYEKWLEKIGLS